MNALRLMVLHVLILCNGCQHSSSLRQVDALHPTSTLSPAEERDEIYSLLAYATVLKDWQTGGQDQRGHNIGSILVDPNGKVVDWAVNCNHITKNGTQHGEVRLMLGYLSKVKTYNLKGHTVYTTLEPCAQCAGMMILQNVQRTVYGQTDPTFGNAMERLQLDSSKFHGFIPYPRPVTSEKSKSAICAELDDAYAKAPGTSGITGFLLSSKARAIYEKARQQLLAFKPRHTENDAVQRDAVEFLNQQVSDHYRPINPKI